MTWMRVRRMAWVLVVLFASTGAGWVIAQVVLEVLGKKVWLIEDGYEIGTFLALGGMVLLFIKDLVSAALSTWSYIWSDDGSHPNPREISVWTIEATVAIAILTVVFDAPKLGECPDDWKTCVHEANDLSRSCFVRCMRDLEVDYVKTHITRSKNEILEDHKITTLRSIASTPLLFENAQTGGKDDIDEESRGVALQADHIHKLRRIARVLDDACSSPNRDVTLRVVGSPSKARFRDKPPEESDRLNLRVANLRAKVVGAALCEVLEESGLGDVSVVAHEWKVFAEIQHSAFPGVDHISLKDPEHQARSVFISMDAPSACFRDSKPMKEEDSCPRKPTPPTS